MARHDYRFHRSVEKLYYVERNRLIYLLTHDRLRTLAVIAPALAVFEALMLLYACGRRASHRRIEVPVFDTPLLHRVVNPLFERYWTAVRSSAGDAPGGNPVGGAPHATVRWRPW